MRLILVSVLVVIISLAAYCAHAENERDDQVQREKFDVVMSEKIEQLYIQAKNWKEPLTLKVEDERLEGDYKVLSEFVLKYWMDNIESRNQYLRELDQAKWDEFLNVQRLEQDKKSKYQNTEQMFIQVKKIQEDYQKRYDLIYAEAIDDLNQLDLQANLRSSMQEKLEHSREKNNEQALFALEIQIMHKAEEMFEFLKKHEWQRRNTMFLFKDDETVNRFNQLYRELNNLQGEIDKLKSQNAQVIQSQTVSQDALVMETTANDGVKKSEN